MSRSRRSAQDIWNYPVHSLFCSPCTLRPSVLVWRHAGCGLESAHDGVSRCEVCVVNGDSTSCQMGSQSEVGIKQAALVSLGCRLHVRNKMNKLGAALRRDGGCLVPHRSRVDERPLSDDSQLRRHQMQTSGAVVMKRARRNKRQPQRRAELKAVLDPKLKCDAEVRTKQQALSTAFTCQTLETWDGVPVSCRRRHARCGLEHRWI